MDKEKTTSHVFFFTIIFMTSVVILTIVGYFLFLPTTAPKLITVAVLPFDAPEEFPGHLTRAFPRHITEVLAESRDLFVVDYDAAEEAVALKSKSRGFRNELGTTHIVSGSYVVSETSDGSWTLQMRLIDVGKDVWKLKWSNEFSYPELSLLEIRNVITKEVAEGLYDNSIPDANSSTITSTGLEQYLRASHLFHTGDQESAIALVQYLPQEQESAYGMFLLTKLVPESREEYVDRTLALRSNFYPAVVLKAVFDYERSKNLVTFLQDTISLASKYPNSEAVPELALLYSDLGWFKEAEDVLFRWAQIRPRSSEPALAIAFNRFRNNDLKGVEHALEIAGLRESANDMVDRYRALYDWKVEGNTLITGTSDFLHWIARYENGDLSFTNPQWITFLEGLTCYEQVEISLYVNNHDYVFDNIDCFDRRLWLQPPPWWTGDDPKWVAFREHPRYEDWQEMRGIRSKVLEVVAPVPAKELFAPRRRVLHTDNGDSDRGIPSP